MHMERYEHVIEVYNQSYQSRGTYFNPFLLLFSPIIPHPIIF